MQTSNPTVTTSKLEAARRQLACAAELFFKDGDAVSIHTLVAAAYQILSDMVKKKGDSMLLERTINSLPEELAVTLRKHFRMPQNFFKHADKDGTETIEFSPTQTQYMLLDATAYYWQLTGEQPLILKAFEKWFAVHHPEMWKSSPETYAMLKRASQHFEHLDRQQFLSEFLTYGT